MFRFTLLLFIVIPLIELFVLIEVGGVLGALPTVLLTIFTAVFGVALMRRQGVTTMQKAQTQMAQGQAPATEMMEGVLIFIGGLFILIFGLITDALGFVFLIPPVRRLMAQKIIAQRQAYYARQGGGVYETQWHEKEGSGEQRVYVQHVHTEARSTNTADASAHNGSVIEGEATEHTQNDETNPRR